MTQELKQKELERLKARITNAPVEIERCIRRAEKYRSWETKAAAQVKKLRVDGNKKKATARAEIMRGHGRKVEYYLEQAGVVDRERIKCEGQLARIQAFDKRAIPLVGQPIDIDTKFWTRTNVKSVAATWTQDYQCQLEKVNGYYWGLFDTLGDAMQYTFRLPSI